MLLWFLTNQIYKTLFRLREWRDFSVLYWQYKQGIFKQTQRWPRQYNNNNNNQMNISPTGETQTEKLPGLPDPFVPYGRFPGCSNPVQFRAGPPPGTM
jgi:hypothetical protein